MKTEQMFIVYGVPKSEEAESEIVAEGRSAGALFAALQEGQLFSSMIVRAPEGNFQGENVRLQGKISRKSVDVMTRVNSETDEILSVRIRYEICLE
jgi:hypothetical protein